MRQNIVNVLKAIQRANTKKLGLLIAAFLIVIVALVGGFMFFTGGENDPENQQEQLLDINTVVNEGIIEVQYSMLVEDTNSDRVDVAVHFENGDTEETVRKTVDAGGSGTISGSEFDADPNNITIEAIRVNSGLISDSDTVVQSVSEDPDQIRNQLVGEFNPEQFDSVEAGVSATFNAEDHVTAQNDISVVEWNLGNGTSKNGTTVNHIYDESGEYTIEMYVEDVEGNTARTGGQISISNPSLSVMSTSDSITVGPDSEVEFVASDLFEINNDVNSYTWEIEDETKSGETVQHTFTESGTYNVSLSIIDEFEQIQSSSVDVNVLGELTVDIEGPDEVVLGESAQFNASVSDEESIDTYEWEIGNETYRGESVTHQFNNSGTTSVGLTVTDAVNRERNVTKNVSIGSPPTANISINSTMLEVGDRFEVSAENSTAEDSEIVSYDWDFGDNTSNEGEQVSHEYSEEGEYTIELTVENENGLQDTDSVTVEAEQIEDQESQTHTVAVAPNGNLEFSPANLTIQAGDTVRFEWESNNHNINVTNQPENANWTGVEDTKETDYIYENTFQVEGEYDYVSDPFRNNMEGTIIVE